MFKIETVRFLQNEKSKLTNREKFLLLSKMEVLSNEMENLKRKITTNREIFLSI